MEYYIYNIPVFVLSETLPSVDIPVFCREVEGVLAPGLLRNVEVVYIGAFAELSGRNAAFTNGAIYITGSEPTNFDILENFIHEVAHSLEVDRAWEIYDDRLLQEFLGKRRRLKDILEAEGFTINPLLYDFTEYNKKFDEFLSDVVGYPMLLNLTMGLFASPYGATSIQEYFANGFEKFFLDGPGLVKAISPVLYQKIDNILNDDA
tara:strand:+ start:490 stop:1107 length:618 start_codon:yes stop_codon:yes gene_type:complete